MEILLHGNVFEVASLIFVFFYGQYLLLAGVAYVVFWHWGKLRFAHRRIQSNPRPAKPWQELGHSTIAIVCFSATLVIGMYAGRAGWFNTYTDIAQYGWAWFVFTVVLMGVVHDSYYYWAHRFMHHPALFRHVHKVHHSFPNPTPFACNAFHPFDAAIEVMWVPLFLLVIPTHPYAVATYVVVFTTLNVMAHLGYEFASPRIARWFITSTHHNMHHSGSKGHFMLYFNWWDRWQGSNESHYEARIREIHKRTPFRNEADAGVAVGTVGAK